MKKKQKISIWHTPYKTEIPKNMINDVKTKHPNKEVSVSFNIHFELDQLADNESVCWGDGKTFVFILKEIKKRI